MLMVIRVWFAISHIPGTLDDIFFGIVATAMISVILLEQKTEPNSSSVMVKPVCTCEGPYWFCPMLLI
jgi:hypothetical protein